MDMCISQREELEIRPWELKGERLKRLRVKGYGLKIITEWRVFFKTLTIFDQDVLFPSVRVFSNFGL